MHRHTHNTYKFPCHPYPSRNRLVACKRHIIFFLSNVLNDGKIWVNNYFKNFNHILSSLGKIDELHCHQYPSRNRFVTHLFSRMQAAL